MDIYSIITIFAGLVLFLYGMNVMGAGLESIAGRRMQSIIEKATNKPIKGLLVGATVSALIQSSSATTVMLVGFVNSGLMKLNHTVSVIIGAGIGTTITSWILSLLSLDSNAILIRMFKPEFFAPILGVVGIAMLMMSKRNKQKDIGRIFIGFFVLMFGMITMYEAVKPLSEVKAFTDMLTAFSNPILGILSGTAFTAIIQSSAATVGILQALSITGIISYSGVIPLVLGANIGTCATALISSIGTNKNAKRTAVIHLYIKIAGSILFMGIFYLLHLFIDFSFMDSAVTSVGIAIIHTLFNIFNALVMMPFSNLMVKLAEMTVKDKGNGAEQIILDERFLNAPTVAVEQCKKQIRNMAELTRETILMAIPLINKYDAKTAQIIADNENLIDMYEDKLGTYIVKLGSRELHDRDNREISKILYSISDFERISDHACNIVDVAHELYEKKITFSAQANKELAVMAAAVIEIVNTSIDAFMENDFNKSYSVEPLEQVIDELKLILKAHHIERLQEGNCTIELGFILSDLINNYERVADHCSNIAALTSQIEDGVFDTHEYLHRIKQTDQKRYMSVYNKFHDKYDVTKESILNEYYNVEPVQQTGKKPD